MIVDALHQVGAARSIVVDEQNTILAGNGVVDAAAEAGLTKVHVVDADGSTIVAVRRRGLSVAQKRALAIYDNRTAELATWNLDQLRADQVDGLDLAAFWREDELTALLEAVQEPSSGLTDPDAIPPERATEIQRGDLFTLGDHRLLCGDSTCPDIVQGALRAERADCVFTSPPYGVGISYGLYEDTFDNLRALLPKIATLWRDVVVDGGFAVVNFGDLVSGRVPAESDTVCEYPMALQYWPAFRAAGWVLWSRRVWCKPGAAVGSSRHCIGTNRAASNFEHVWTWKLPGYPPPVDDQISGVFPSQAGWFDTSHDSHLDIGLQVHGAGMPTAVAIRMIVNHSRMGAMVYEPFAGTGTTLIAAERLGRRCLAMEIEPRWCQLIIDRWEAFTGRHAEKI